MKIRQGFVSNSSSQSFTIFGWTKDDLHLDWEGQLDLVKSIKEIYPDLEILNDIPHPEHEWIMGVGESAADMDHYMQDWEDFRCEGPTQEEMDKLSEVATLLSLPEPHSDQRTWYYG